MFYLLVSDLPIFLATSLTASAVSVKYDVCWALGIVFTALYFLPPGDVFCAKAVKASVKAEQGILDIGSIIRNCREKEIDKRKKVGNTVLYRCSIILKLFSCALFFIWWQHTYTQPSLRSLAYTQNVTMQWNHIFWWSICCCFIFSSSSYRHEFIAYEFVYWNLGVIAFKWIAIWVFLLTAVEPWLATIA